MWLELKFRNCFITNGENTTHTKTRVYYRLFVVCVCILVLKITNHCVQVWCPWQPPVFAVVHTLPQEVLPLPLSHLFLTNSHMMSARGLCSVQNDLFQQFGGEVRHSALGNPLCLQCCWHRAYGNLLCLQCCRHSAHGNLICSGANIVQMATPCVCSGADLVPMTTLFAVLLK